MYFVCSGGELHDLDFTDSPLLLNEESIKMRMIFDRLNQCLSMFDMFSTSKVQNAIVGFGCLEDEPYPCKGRFVQKR